jgi:translation initiation factor 2 subunit 2
MSCENIILTIEEKIGNDSSINNIDEELENMFNLGKKKKKSKDKDKKEKEKNNESDQQINIQRYELQRDTPSYTYKDLLSKFYEQISDLNINKTTNKFMIGKPIVVSMSSKKVVWTNFKETCDGLNRHIDHLFSYITSELNTDASINENKQMIIKGKFHSKNIENILRKYVCCYVQCSMCRSYETEITKDSNTRLNYLVCLSCKSSKTIPVIKKTNINK